LKKRFELIVIDSPPIGAVTDRACYTRERADADIVRLPVQPGRAQTYPAIVRAT